MAHVYLGSKRHMMERIFNDENEPFWRSARQMELGVIDPPALRGLPRGQLRADGQEDRPGDRSPRCSRRRAAIRTRPRSSATSSGRRLRRAAGAGLAEYERALADVLRAEHAHFELIWDQASTVQRLTLQALAHRARTSAERRLPPSSQAAGSVDRPACAPGADAERARHPVGRRVPDRRAVPGRLAPRPRLTHLCVTRLCVITGIGLAAILAKRTFRRFELQGRVIGLLPAISALVIVIAGAAMTVRAIPKVS